MPLFLSHGQGYGRALVKADGQDMQAGSSLLCWPADLSAELSVRKVPLQLMASGLSVPCTRVTHSYVLHTTPEQAVSLVSTQGSQHKCHHPERARICDLAQLARCLIHRTLAYSRCQFTNPPQTLLSSIQDDKRENKSRDFAVCSKSCKEVRGKPDQVLMA